MISCYIRFNAASLTFRAKPTWTASLAKGQYTAICWSVRYGEWGNLWSSCFLSVTSDWIKLVAPAGLSIGLLVNKRTPGVKQYSCTKRKNDHSHLKFTFSGSPGSIILGLGYIFELLHVCPHESYSIMTFLMGSVKRFYGWVWFWWEQLKNSAAQI